VNIKSSTIFTFFEILLEATAHTFRLEGKRQKAIIQTALASFLWGTSFVAIKIGLVDLDPIWFVEWRLAASSLMLLAIYARSTPFRIYFSDKWLWLLGFLNGICFLVQYIGMQSTSAGVAAFLINFSMIFTALFSWWWLKESFGIVKVLGVITALAGAILLSGGLNAMQESGSLFGNLLVMLSGIFWAGCTVMSKFVLTRSGYNETTMTAMILFMAALWILPFALLWGDLKFFGEAAWYVLIYTTIFCTVLPFVFWLRALRYISATYSAAILLLEPVFAAVLGFLILNERLTLAELIGAVLILVAIGMISLSRK